MKYLVLVLIVSFSSISFSQVSIPDNKLVKSPQAIVNELMNIISGDTTEVRDWEHFRSLFIPSAQFIIKNHNPRQRPISTLSLEDFVRMLGPTYQKNGFLEEQLEVRVDEYNGIAQVFQVYHCKTLNGAYEAKGVNSYQLVYGQNRWWIASLMWASDDNGVEVPEKL